MKNPQSKNRLEDFSQSSGPATLGKGFNSLSVPQTSVFVSSLTQESHFQRGLFVSVLIDSPYAFAPYEIRLPLQKTDEAQEEADKAMAHALSRITLKENPYKVFYSLPVDPDFDKLNTSDFASIDFEAIEARENPSYPALRQFLRKHGTY